MAMRVAWTTASGSSPFTWKIGACTISAISDAIGRRAREERCGGETDLVVDHEMHGAAGAEALDARHGEAFRHHALAREGGVAMHQDRQDGGAGVDIRRSCHCLARALPSTTGLTISRCDGLAVSDRCTLWPSNSRSTGGAQMVLHVAGAFDIRRIGGAALEFVEQLAIGLAHHIDQHVEAAAMGHAHHDFADAELAAALDDLLQRRNGGFGAIQAEALGADETVGGELLEAFGFDQLVEDRFLAFLA